MLKQQFTNTINKYITLWDTLDGPDPFTDKHLWIKRQYRYFRIKRQLKSILKRVDLIEFSADTPDLSRFKNDPQIGRLLDTWLQFDVWHMDQSLDGDYAAATEQFIKRARSLWPKMPSADIFQALRNVWIMIAIQILAKCPVVLTDAMFAYSMLYPLTDNVIDHPDLSKEDKASFVTRLGVRLQGEVIEPNSIHEKDAFDMVALIESTFDRTLYPDVYTSILLIHDAQKQSMAQQYNTLDEKALMQLSFEKGAASVVADGFLVLGHLSEDFLEFLTAYGIVLQLADDLQDIETDAANHHQTLFNTTSSPMHLARITKNLSTLSLDILKAIPTEDVNLKMQMTALLGKSMQILICDAIQTHRTRYAKAFYKRVNQSHFMGLKNHERLKTMSQNLLNTKLDQK